MQTSCRSNSACSPSLGAAFSTPSDEVISDATARFAPCGPTRATKTTFVRAFRYGITSQAPIEAVLVGHKVDTATLRTRPAVMRLHTSKGNCNLPPA